MKLTVTSAFGTFTRSTKRPYRFVVVGRCVGRQAERSPQGATFYALRWTQGDGHSAAAEFLRRPDLWTDIKILDVDTGLEAGRFQENKS